MARIRTIKPEFWQDEKLAPLPPLDRLVFLGLISQADDAGRLNDNIRLLNGLLFPDTDDDCSGSLETLARLGRVLRYTSDSGQRLLQITNWEEHQRVDNPSKYTLPPPPPEVVEPQGDTEPSGDSSEGLARTEGDPSVPILDQRPTTNDQRPPFEGEFLGFWEAYPLKIGKKDALEKWRARRRAGVSQEDLMAGLARYLAWAKATDTKLKYPATFLGPKEWWAEPWHIPESAVVKEPPGGPQLDPKFKRDYTPEITERKPTEPERVNIDVSDYTDTAA